MRSKQLTPRSTSRKKMIPKILHKAIASQPFDIRHYYSGCMLRKMFCIHVSMHASWIWYKTASLTKFRPYTSFDVQRKPLVRTLTGHAGYGCQSDTRNSRRINNISPLAMSWDHNL